MKMTVKNLVIDKESHQNEGSSQIVVKPGRNGRESMSQVHIDECTQEDEVLCVIE